MCSCTIVKPISPSCNHIIVDLYHCSQHPHGPPSKHVTREQRYLYPKAFEVTKSLLTKFLSKCPEYEEGEREIEGTCSEMDGPCNGTANVMTVRMWDVEGEYLGERNPKKAAIWRILGLGK